MYKEILRNIENVEIWPLISFVIFFLFFLILLIWVFTTDKNYIRHMKQLPLEKDTGSDDNLATKEELLTKTSLSQ